MPENDQAVVTPEPETELGEAGKKAIAAERRRADALDKELKAFKAAAEAQAASEMTELERLKKENADLVSSKSAADLESIRFRVALEKGIPANLAPRLQGTDYDTLAADADSLSELVTGNKPASPRPDPSQGPTATPGAQSPAQAFADHIKSQLGQ